MITALCGGVGGSKLALGLYRVVAPDTLSVVVNTADDLDLYGLRISPDVDTVTYTLAGLAQKDAGWGIEGDTFATLDTLGRYGVPTWFNVGDRDFATHIYRSHGLRSGRTLTDITSHIAHSLGVRARILPMTNDPVATRIRASGEWLAFQEYFVRERHRVAVDAVEYVGVESAEPTPAVVEAIRSAEILVLVNSNPVLSLLPILSLPGIRALFEDVHVPTVAVSPLVGTSAVSGPAGELMRLIGCPPDARGVAQAYAGVIDGLVIDRRDEHLASDIEQTGVRVLAADTIMRDDADRDRVARETLAFAHELT